MFQNVLFYQYISIKNPTLLRDEERKITKSLNLLGKILVSEEGINGNVSGSKDETDAYMHHLKQLFPDIEFKIGLTKDHNFNKMIVRTRPEICAFKQDVSLENKAPYIEPEELKELLESDEDVVLIDARNKYEAEFGTFEDAIVPDIKVFRDFPEYVENNLKDLKDKKIVTFCTGGIRCEKASAYLKEKGFEDVQQLHGGILTYGEKVGSDHWDGECFVFDERLAVSMENVKEVHPNRANTSCATPAYFKKELNKDK